MANHKKARMRLHLNTLHCTPKHSRAPPTPAIQLQHILTSHLRSCLLAASASQNQCAAKSAENREIVWTAKQS